MHAKPYASPANASPRLPQTKKPSPFTHLARGNENDLAEGKKIPLGNLFSSESNFWARVSRPRAHA